MDYFHLLPRPPSSDALSVHHKTLSSSICSFSCDFPYPATSDGRILRLPFILYIFSFRLSIPPMSSVKRAKNRGQKRSFLTSVLLIFCPKTTTSYGTATLFSLFSINDIKLHTLIWHERTVSTSYPTSHLRECIDCI